MPISLLFYIKKYKRLRLKIIIVIIDLIIVIGLIIIITFENKSFF